MAAQTVRDWRRAARSKVHGYPEIKQKTKDATNSDLWGPTDAQKSEIAESSFNEDNRALVLKALWKRVDDKTEYWMHVYKALDVLEYLLLVDVPGIFNDLRFHHQQLTQLQQYMHAKHKDPKEQEKLNDKVRIKAARLLNLMGDGDLLLSERQKLRLIMARVTGVSDAQLEAAGESVPRSSVPPPASRPTSMAATGGAGAGIRQSTGPGARGSVAAGGSRAVTPPQAQGGAGGVGDDFEIDMDVLSQLIEMGFTDQDACMTAIMAADNNLDRAVQYVLASPNGGVAFGNEDTANTSSPPPPPATTSMGPTTSQSGGSTSNPNVGDSTVQKQGMSDIFTPASGGTNTAATHGKNNGSQAMVDIFTQPAATTPPGNRGSMAAQTGLWNPQAEAKPEPAPVTRPTASNVVFDPFAPDPTPPPPVNSTSGGAMPDFFANNTRPQEVTKRQGVTPPPAHGGGAPDFFSTLGSTSSNSTAPLPAQQTQQTNLFGAGAGNQPAPSSQTDLFGNGGGAPASNGNGYGNGGGQPDLFGTPSPAAHTSSPAQAVPNATGSTPPAQKKELTKQEKMMMEFQMMGKPQGQKQNQPKSTGAQPTLDQLMLGGQKYGGSK